MPFYLSIHFFFFQALWNTAYCVIDLQRMQLIRPGLQLNPQINPKNSIIQHNIIMKLLILLLLCYNCIGSDEISSNTNNNNNRDILQVKNSEDDVVWIVQLSDLHFSVHYPQRAFEFQQFVSSTLSMINPSLVLITGDLTGILITIWPVFVIRYVCIELFDDLISVDFDDALSQFIICSLSDNCSAGSSFMSFV